MPHPPREDLRPYFLTLHDLEGVIDWREYFGNGHPVEIDVGSGRGMFLLKAALANPGTNYLGIELDYKEGRRGARKLKKRQLPNARVLGGDVRVAFEELIEPGSVSAVHVYFPDPWWKRKHKKRRLFTDLFTDQMARVLKPGGLVHVWTDVEDYFRDMAALMDHHGQFEPIPPPPEHEPQHDMDYVTSFERKKRQEGSTIYRGRWRKIERPDSPR